MESLLAEVAAFPVIRAATDEVGIECPIWGFVQLMMNEAPGQVAYTCAQGEGLAPQVRGKMEHQYMKGIK